MNGKINLRVPFILKLTFSKMKFHKIRRAPSTITKKNVLWLQVVDFSFSFFNVLFKPVRQRKTKYYIFATSWWHTPQFVHLLRHGHIFYCKDHTLPCFRKGYVIRMKSIRRGFLCLGLGRSFFHTFFLPWGFQWKRYKRWSSVCRPCGVENK